MVKRSAGLAVLVALSMLAAAPAWAMPRTGPEAEATAGRLTLYSQPNGGGVVQQVTYTACQVHTTVTLARVGSFANAPLPDCLAVLVNGAGRRYALCIGRGNVPAEFEGSRTVLVARGASARCPAAPPAGRDGARGMGQ